MNKTGCFVIMLAIVFMPGCRSKELYNAMQGKQKTRCQGLLPPEYDECMGRVNESYDGYKHKRDEAIERK